MTIQNCSLMEKGEISEPVVNNEVLTEDKEMNAKEAALNTVISFNCKSPTYFFKLGDASGEFKKIKHDAELEECLEPIDMQVAKKYLESAFTGAIELNREIASAIEADEAHGWMEYFKKEARQVEISFEGLCQHLNIRMMYVCPDTDWCEEPGDFLSTVAILILSSETPEQLFVALQMMTNIIMFTCEYGRGAYANNPNFREFEEYCTYINFCSSCVMMAA